MGDANNALVIINRKSSRAGRDISAAMSRLEAGGLRLDVRPTDDPEQISDLIRDGAADADMVVVGGGDGTLSTAAEAVMESGLPLGILPLGAANDLASSLGIGKGLHTACEIILHGRLLAVNLGVVNNKLFFNTAHLGMTVDMVKRLSSSDKRRFGFLAYMLKMFQTYWGSRNFSARIVCDGEEHRATAMEMFVANGARYGGGFRVAREASLTENTLICHVVERQPALRILVKIPAFYRGTLEGKSNVLTLRGGSFQLETDPIREIMADGEIVARTPANIDFVPRALPVYVPASYPMD